MLNAKTATILSSILLLGACSHYSDNLASLDNSMKAQPAPVTYAAAPQDIAPAAGGASMNALPQYLAREYYDLAKYENDKAYDYKAAKNYTNKSLTASKGQLTVPAKISSYDLSPEKAKELSAARAELITALKTQNTPENAGTLAKAQSRFDCWIEREEEASDETHAAPCKSEFEGAMAMLIMPAAGEASTVYDIGFAGDSNVVDPAGKSTLEYVANFLKAPENAAYAAQVSGGNQHVAAILGAFSEKGVDAMRLRPVVTPDNAAKVQVTLVPVTTTVVNPASVMTTSPDGTTKREFIPVDPKVVKHTGN